jgi:hypothetical protein
VVPGAAWAAAGGATAAGWSIGSVRFEPLTGSDGLTVAGTGTFRGSIEVRRNGGALAVRNDVALEDYVRGIDEVPPAWPAAALQAQAIAARTYAAHKAQNADARWQAVGADICATSACQVYRGLDAERRAAGHGWLPAVESTAGQALLAGGAPIMASYSSTANGPQAMSQNGALAMAIEGRSAAEILQAYYGLRPTSAPGRLPATIRVAVIMSTAKVRISSGAGFRVVDGAGAELAVAPGGDWTVVAGADGIRLLPPDSYRPDPVDLAVAQPAEPTVHSPGRALTAASAPARREPWAAGATALVAVAGTSAGALRRRRARLMRAA